MPSPQELLGQYPGLEAHPDVMPHAREHLMQHQTIVTATLRVLAPLLAELNPAPEPATEE